MCPGEQAEKGLGAGELCCPGRQPQTGNMNKRDEENHIVSKQKKDQMKGKPEAAPVDKGVPKGTSAVPPVEMPMAKSKHTPKK